ncbi:MAG TPA: hypothetical protein VK708_13530 [Bryobacteraceae bacterium]|nr:hypothetical protein [Bryobacteraceae bacterium]
MMSSKRWWYTVWLVLIGAFAVLHALHLRADFPNHSPWWMDWAKYTDEGWYGNAAIRAHLNGSWHLPDEFNPAAALPAWPLLEWILFFFTGVTVEAARGLAIVIFFINLALSYTLLRTRGPRWMALLAVTLLVTSPLLYSFSRLAILEPLLTTLTLGALNLAVRLPRLRRPVLAAVGIGFLFTLMVLTKTTAVFLFPALGWAIVLPLRQRRALLFKCAGAAAGAFAFSFGMWMALIVRHGLLADFKFFFVLNNYPKPTEFYWPLISFWWSFHGGLWIDHILIPLAWLVAAGVAITCRKWGRRLLLDPVFGSSVLAVAGCILFMTVQNHPQPRYFAVAAFFFFFMVAQGAHALLGAKDDAGRLLHRERGFFRGPASALGWLLLGIASVAVGINGAATLNYGLHPEYTFANAAERLTRYIDEHPNGKRLLVCDSGDEITLVTHMPALNDLYIDPSGPIPDLATKLGYYQPGWYASWNTLDPGMLEDIHTRYSVEQVARFRAYDDPERNVLVLFKLHPWPDGRVKEPADRDLSVRFAEDKFDVPLQ